MQLSFGGTEENSPAPVVFFASLHSPHFVCTYITYISTLTTEGHFVVNSWSKLRVPPDRELSRFPSYTRDGPLAFMWLGLRVGELRFS